jgi:ribonuclease PH
LLKSRPDGRVWDQIRPITIIYDILGNAHGSVLFKLGNTQVLCSVIMQDGVPSFLRGKGKGWVTAEYAMLPGSTTPRTVRESSSGRKDGRSVEISRLIGRSLRAVVDLSLLGERTLYIDCDVIQADGGTRTAAITGAYCALRHALRNHKFPIIVPETFLHDSVGALSVGFSDNNLLLDINFQEDVSIGADFNFVMTGSGNIIEVQGATESKPLSWETVQSMQKLAAEGIIGMLKDLP